MGEKRFLSAKINFFVREIEWKFNYDFKINIGYVRIDYTVDVCKSPLLRFDFFFLTLLAALINGLFKFIDAFSLHGGACGT